MKLSDFNFQLVKLRKNSGDRATSLVNEIFFFWKNFWTQVLNELEAPCPHWADEFYRHDAAGIISKDGVPVAVHLYGIQNLKLAPCRGQSYFQEGFDEKFCSLAVKNGYQMAMSAAWLSVNQDFVKNPGKIVFSRCLMALALKVSDRLGCQTVIGPTRVNNGVAAKIIEWGAVSYGRRIAHNTPIEMLVMDNSIEIPLPEKESELINQLWSPIIGSNKKAA